MSWFKKSSKEETTDNKAEIGTVNTSNNEVKHVEMIWIDGYKGTDQNMRCNGYQYELNKEITYDGEISLCRSGFHFCTNLNNVFDYYSYDGKNRFFKVKALMPKDYQKDSMDFTKYVTNKIIFVSEITDYKLFKEQIDRHLPFIETEDDYSHIKDYDVFSKNKFVKKMIDLGYSELFSLLIADNTSSLYEAIKYVKAIDAENISKDIQIYLLMQYVKDHPKKHENLINPMYYSMLSNRVI